MSGSAPTYRDPDKAFVPVPEISSWMARHTLHDADARQRFLDVCHRFTDSPGAVTCWDCGRALDGRNTAARCTVDGVITCTRACTLRYFGRG